MTDSRLWRERLAEARHNPLWRLLVGEGQSRRRFGVAALAVAAASIAMVPFREQLGVLNIMLLFLMLAFVLGLTLGGGPAALGAVLAFISFDFIFLEPYFTMTVARRDHVLGLFVYLGIAMASAALMARVRKKTTEAVRESRRTAILYDLNRALVGDVTVDRLLQTIAESVVSVYGSTGCRVLSANEDGGLRVRAAWPLDLSSEIDRQAAFMAQWAIEQRVPAGLGSAGRRIRVPHGRTLPPKAPLARKTGDVLYIPIVTPDRVPGVLEVTGKPDGGRFNDEDERLLSSFADQAALALERTRLTEEATRAAVLEQSNDLKSALLAAVSHDLRTPLTAIKASSSAMLDRSVPWTDEARAELLETIDEETDRLTLMVSNLLDLSRIEGGALRPDKGWHDLAELIQDTVRRIPRQCGHHAIQVVLEPELPLIHLDYVEIAQVLVNLLGNACKYSVQGTAIIVSARRSGDEVEIRVRDHGSGIDPARLPHIFETFYRAHEGGAVAGSGIGLSICKGLVEAHGGTIRAESRVGEGTTMIVRLPIGEDSG